MTLTPDELSALTKRTRSDGQRRQLEEWRIPYRTRRDGSLAVLRDDVRPGGTITKPREPELHL